MTTLSTIIVSYNVRDLLRQCLCSIEREQIDQQIEIIVVDSASEDGTVEMLRQEFRHIRLIEPGENVGFSRGNNLGIAASQGQYILLLNPDTRILEGALTSMIHYLEEHPLAGVVGPCLLNEDGTLQSSRRRFPTLWTAFFESTWLESIAPHWVLDRYFMHDVPEEATTPVDWLTGAALLVRRTVIEQIGSLDEGYFMYSEELDWQHRIRNAGWLIVYLPEAQIVHYGGKSSEQAIASRHILFQSSKIRYFTKYHGRVVGVLLRLFLLAMYAAQLALEAAKGLIGHRRALRRERVDTYWQVLRSGLKGV